MINTPNFWVFALLWIQISNSNPSQSYCSKTHDWFATGFWTWGWVQTDSTVYTHNDIEFSSLYAVCSLPSWFHGVLERIRAVNIEPIQQILKTNTNTPWFRVGAPCSFLLDTKPPQTARANVYQQTLHGICAGQRVTSKFRCHSIHYALVVQKLLKKFMSMT